MRSHRKQKNLVQSQNSEIVGVPFTWTYVKTESALFHETKLERNRRRRKNIDKDFENSVFFFQIRDFCCMLNTIQHTNKCPANLNGGVLARSSIFFNGTEFAFCSHSSLQIYRRFSVTISRCWSAETLENMVRVSRMSLSSGIENGMSQYEFWSMLLDNGSVERERSDMSITGNVSPVEASTASFASSFYS